MNPAPFHPLLVLVTAAWLASGDGCAAAEPQAAPRGDKKILKATGKAVMRGVIAQLQGKDAAEPRPVPLAEPKKEPKANNAWLAAADREAAVLCIVAALDQVMLLSEAQREKLLAIVSDRWQGPWRTARTWHALVNPRRAPWQTAMLRAALGVLEIPEEELAPALRPAQLAACRELRVFAMALGQREASEPRPPEVLFDLSLDDVAEICDLTEDQRTRLWLTGKSDVGRANEQTDRTARFREANEKHPTAPALVAASLPAGTLPGDLPRYRKGLEQWLTAEQRQQLAAAHQRRREFERRAELAAIVRIVRYHGAASEAQGEQLAESIADQLCDVPLDRDDDVSVRAQLLAALAQLRSDEMAEQAGADRKVLALLWKQLRSEVQAMHLAEAITSAR